MAELTEVVAEAAETVAEEALEVAKVSRSLSGRDVSIGFALGAIVGGVGVGWLVLRRIEKKYNLIAEEEIAEIRAHYRRKREQDFQEQEATVVEEPKPALDEIVQERGYTPPIPGGLNVSQEVARQTAEQIVGIVKNVFDDEDWNFEEELAARTPDKPYVIHQEELEEHGYVSVSLAYYEGDDILCDEQNKPVDNKDVLVGEDNLSKFGHGSGNPHIVFIRNEKLELDMEVIKHEGTFIGEVHGLKHSERRRRRPRFHGSDED